MPYDLKTKDNIILRNIPDDIPEDDPIIKEKIISLREKRDLEDAEDVQGASDISPKRTGGRGSRAPDLVERDPLSQSPVETAARSFTDTLSFGFMDSLQGLETALRSAYQRGEITKEQFIQDYERGKEYWNTRAKEGAEQNPKSSVAGALATAAIPVMAPINTLKAATTTGAAIGAISGLGHSKGETLGEVAEDIIEGATVGTVVGPLVHKVSGIISKGIGGLGSKVNSAIKNRVKGEIKDLQLSIQKISPKTVGDLSKHKTFKVETPIGTKTLIKTKNGQILDVTEGGKPIPNNVTEKFGAEVSKKDIGDLDRLLEWKTAKIQIDSGGKIPVEEARKIAHKNSGALLRKEYFKAVGGALKERRASISKSIDSIKDLNKRKEALNDYHKLTKMFGKKIVDKDGKEVFNVEVQAKDLFNNLDKKDPLVLQKEMKEITENFNYFKDIYGEKGIKNAIQETASDFAPALKNISDVSSIVSGGIDAGATSAFITRVLPTLFKNQRSNWGAKKTARILHGLKKSYPKIIKKYKPDILDSIAIKLQKTDFQNNPFQDIFKEAMKSGASTGAIHTALLENNPDYREWVKDTLKNQGREETLLFKPKKTNKETK